VSDGIPPGVRLLETGIENATNNLERAERKVKDAAAALAVVERERRQAEARLEALCEDRDALVMFHQLREEREEKPR
jgi:hypothetical protein